MDLCLAQARRPGSRVANWWWEQESLEPEEMQTADREEEQT